MSNSLAIAAVTATLRNLLHAGVTNEPDLADASITMQPLDRARTNGSNANQINLFLYHVVPSPAWRNQGIPGRVRPGESGFPALGLNLYYLITAFGRDNDMQQPFSHQLMGRAMSVLNDHPLLGADEIKSALPNNDLWAQQERVRITLQPFAIEEIAKLWTGFQTQYRLSVAYEAAVVLIESERPSRTPLPVLTRGPADTGYFAQANLSSPLPMVNAITIPNGQVTAELGDSITLVGQNLTCDSAMVQFSNLRLTTPLLVTGSGLTDQQITVVIPKKTTQWPAGVYTVSAILTRAGVSDSVTNELPLAIAPKITSPLPLKATSNKNGMTLSLACSPTVLPGQRISLLLGDQEFPAASPTAATSQFTFPLSAIQSGTYFVRLRVDGVDSQLIDHSVTPPQFDPKQQVTIP
jgi:hypothetical protein